MPARARVPSSPFAFAVARKTNRCNVAWLALGVLLACGGSETNRGAQQDGGPRVVDSAVPETGSDDAGLDAGSHALIKLSETGLYADLVQETLGPGVRAYEPQGVLWADGASKKRWVYLPPGAQIDTSDMDNWVYPVGTKLWKEFRVNGKRLETRLIEKVSESEWTLVAFQWNAEQTEAMAVPKGVKNASGTSHDIPSTDTCKRCHAGVKDTALGFSAVQLSHDGSGVTLAKLIKEQRLSGPPSAPLQVPGKDPVRAALLYLHANCGHCHNGRSFISGVTGVDYWLHHERLASVDVTSAYHSLNVDLRKHGSVEKTDVLKRMRFRGQGQMPPVASKQVDSEGVALVRAFLETLPHPAADAGAHDGGVTLDADLADAGDAASPSNSDAGSH